MIKKTPEQAQIDMMQTTKEAFIKHASALKKSMDDEEINKQIYIKESKLLKIKVEPSNKDDFMINFRDFSKEDKYKAIFNICSDNTILHQQNTILRKRMESVIVENKELNDTNEHLNELYDQITDDEEDTKKKSDARILSLRNKCKEKNETIITLRYIAITQFVIILIPIIVRWIFN